MMRRLGFLWVCALVGFSFPLSEVRGLEPVLRDPWMQPFNAESIWNTSIGEGSDLAQVKLRSAYEVEPELEYIYQISNKPFKRNIFALRNWERRINGDKKLDEIPIDDFILGAKLNEVNRRTACSALLMPDRHTVKNFCQFCRTSRSSPCFVMQETEWNLFDQDGLDDGRLTSGMSILGGSLRMDAINRLTDIRHPVKILLPAGDLSIGPDGKGFRWPATRTATTYKEAFKGTNPELTIGSLLTLDPARMEELNSSLASDFGKSFAQTLFRYGAYVVDYSRSNNIGLCMTPEFEKALNQTNDQPRANNAGPFPDSISKDLQAIFANLKVVKDNRPESKAGSGNRRLQGVLAPQIPREQFSRDDETIVGLRNGAMTDGELFPSYWNIIPNSREVVEFGFDDQIFYSPPRSFRFKSLLDRQIGLYQIFEDKRSPLRFSVRVSVNGNVKLTLALLSFAGNVALTDKLETLEYQEEPESNMRAWKLIQATAALPKDAENYRVILLASGDGTVWIDDFDAAVVAESKP